MSATTTATNGESVIHDSGSKTSARIESVLAKLGGGGDEPTVLVRRPNRDASPAEEEPARRGLTDEQIRERRAETEARAEESKARRQEADRSLADTNARIAAYTELERLRKEEPKEFLKRFAGMSIRDAFKASLEEDQLTPAQREVRQLKREVEADRENLNRRLAQEDNAKTERGREQANVRIRGQLTDIFRDVATEAGLSASVLEKVAAKAHRFCLGFYDRNGRAPTMTELDEFGTRLPEFLPFITKKGASATAKPKAAAPRDPSAPRRTINDEDYLRERIAKAAKKFGLRKK